MDSRSAAVILAEAERQAAEGHLGSALRLLDEVPVGVGGVATLMLRAKVLAQRGRFKDSAAVWRSAIEAEPENREAQRGLDLATRLAASPIAGLRLHARRWGLVALVAVAAAFVVWRVWAGPENPSRRELAGTLEQLERRTALSDAAVHDSLATLGVRLREAERLLQSQSSLGEQTRDDLDRELHSIQHRLDETATEKQLRSVRDQIIDLLRNPQPAAPDSSVR